MCKCVCVDRLGDYQCTRECVYSMKGQQECGIFVASRSIVIILDFCLITRTRNSCLCMSWDRIVWEDFAALLNTMKFREGIKGSADASCSMAWPRATYVRCTEDIYVALARSCLGQLCSHELTVQL